MGAAASRAARRAGTSSVRVSDEAVRKAVSQQELQRQAQIQEALKHIPPDVSKNEALVSEMTQLMASIKTRQVALYSNPEVDKLYARKKKSKEELEAEAVGRLSTASLKALYEDRIRAWREGRELNIDQLARQYGANPEVLKAVLQYNSVPAVQREADGRLVGSWPE